MSHFRDKALQKYFTLLAFLGGHLVMRAVVSFTMCFLLKKRAVLVLLISKVWSLQAQRSDGRSQTNTWKSEKALKAETDTQDRNICVVFTVCSVSAPYSLELVMVQAEHKSTEARFSMCAWCLTTPPRVLWHGTREQSKGDYSRVRMAKHTSPCQGWVLFAVLPEEEQRWVTWLA